MAGTAGPWPLGIAPVTAGRILVTIGIAGAIVGIVGSIVAQLLVRDFRDGLAHSLELTGDVLDTVDVTFAVADDALGIVGDGVTEAERAVRSMGASMSDGERALDAATELTGGAVADALEDIERVLPLVEQAADATDEVLAALGALPFAPPYAPEQMLGPTIGELRNALSGLPEELRQQADHVRRTRDHLADATAGTVATADALADLDQRLEDAAALIGDYARRSADARELVDTQRGVLAAAATRARIVIVTFGVLFALGQFVPVYLGLGLARNGGPVGAGADVTDRA